MASDAPPAADAGAPDPSALNLKEVARLLDVHYMTVYRYVRQGQLPARRDGPIWLVDRADAEALRDGRPAGTSASRPRVDWSARLAARLVGGDEVGGWTVLRDALAAGRDVHAIHLDVVAAAVARISTEVGTGVRTPADERIAVATASRLVARLGGQFPHRGRKRGTVVLAAPPGEHHGLPLLVVANLIRHAGYRVVELGTDTPAADVLAAIDAAPSVLAVGIGVTTVERLDDAIELIGAVRAVHPALPVLLGGQAVRNPEVASLAGATAWSAGDDLVAQLDAAVATGRSRRRSAPRS